MTLAPVEINAALFNQCNSHVISNYRLNAFIKSMLNVVGKHYKLYAANCAYPEMPYHHVNQIMNNHVFRFYSPLNKFDLYKHLWDNSWYNPFNWMWHISPSYQLSDVTGVFMGMGVFNKGGGTQMQVGVYRNEGMGYITALHEFDYYSHDLYHVAYNQAGE